MVSGMPHDSLMQYELVLEDLATYLDSVQLYSCTQLYGSYYSCSTRAVVPVLDLVLVGPTSAERLEYSCNALCARGVLVHSCTLRSSYRYSTRPYRCE